MRLCSFIAALALATSSLTTVSSAQLSVYGAAALTDFVFFNNGNSAGKSDTAGLIGGAFYNFPIASRVTVGIDARGSAGFGGRGGGSGIAALRVGFVPHRVILRPYFEIGGGFVSSSVSNGQITGPVTVGLTAQPTRFTNGAAAFIAGLDVRVSEFVDLRAVELGAAAPGSTSTTEVGTGFLDAGIVYHFHRHR